jgi:hypothetical protein
LPREVSSLLEDINTIPYPQGRGQESTINFPAIFAIIL